jgi:hypothetical protein
VKYICLTKGKSAKVDDVDYEWLNQWRWHVIGGKYAARRQYYSSHGERKSRYVYMHRVIAGTPPELDTDHKNGDGLDNRRENIRICTTAQNVANRSKLNRNTTGFKGVTLDRKSGKYVAQIGYHREGIRKNKILGSFSTALEAAVAYEREARSQYGEFARLELLEA